MGEPPPPNPLDSAFPSEWFFGMIPIWFYYTHANFFWAVSTLAKVSLDYHQNHRDASVYRSSPKRAGRGMDKKLANLPNRSPMFPFLPKYQLHNLQYS